MTAATPFRLAVSQITGRGQVETAAGLAIAEVLKTTFPRDLEEREAALALLVAQANQADRLVLVLEALIAEIAEANAFRASWNRAPVIPKAVLDNAKGVAVGARRSLLQVKANAERRSTLAR